MNQSQEKDLIALGLQHQQAGRLLDAEGVYRQVLRTWPDLVDALRLLGSVLYEQGRLPESIRALGRVVELRPADGSAWNDFGVALHTAGQYPDAISAFRRSLALLPDLQQAATNLAEALRVTGEYEQAVAILRSVLAGDPSCVDALNTFGASLTKLGKVDEAIDALRCALTLNPQFTPALNNLAVAFWEKGQLDDAAAAFARLLEIQPNWAMGKYCLGVVQLLQGNFQKGLANYEHRRDAQELGAVYRKFAQPRWNGEQLNGQRILLHVEQGFGDMIQFVRYAPMVIERGGRVILQCQPELSRLFRGIEGIEELILDGAVPQFDVECPLMSLPYALKTTPQTIPARIPYLRADAAMVGRWNQRLSAWRNQLKVGLVWSGRSTPDPARSVPSENLAPLGDLAGVAFFSLQKHDAAQSSHAVPGLKLVDWALELNDFADTAAFIENLDLVITIDTAVAHLTGALGKRTFTLLKSVPDWRWGLNRADSPWYPTMRLFRQPCPGDWSTPIRQVADLLHSDYAVC